MKLVSITENKITKVMLDLETLALPEVEFTPEDTVCDIGRDHSDLTFKVVNEFLATLIEDETKILATGLIDMRKAIAKYGNNYHGVWECSDELTGILVGLVTNPVLKLFEALTAFSDKYIPVENSEERPQDITECTLTRNEQRMLIATSLLSSLCVMVIHDFETHFSNLSVPDVTLYPHLENVSIPDVALYPAFENAIKADSAAAKSFIEIMRAIMKHANHCLVIRMGLPSDRARDVAMLMSSLSILYLNTYMASECRVDEPTINMLGLILMRNERQMQKPL